MALDKDILGQAIYDVRNIYSNKTAAQLITTYGNIEAARLHAAKAEAEVIINHFKANAEGRYQTGTLIAGPNTVTQVGVTVAVKLF